MALDTEFKDAPADSARPAPGEDVSKDNEAPASEKALVKQWLDRVTSARTHWKKLAFDRMEKDEQLAIEGADDAWVKADKYVVPITNRHINLATAQLYAKDPRAQAKRRTKLMYKLWDGKMESLQTAVQAMQPPQTVMPNPDQNAPPMDAASGQPWQPDPNAVAMLQEISQGQQYSRMIDQLGKTVELLWAYYTGESGAGFKQQMKAAVRRTKVKSVSYVKLAFQRELKMNPEIAAQIDDATQQLAQIHLLAEQLAEGDFDDTDARAAELKSMIEQLRQQPQIIAREGPIFDFPRAEEIIVDKKCRHLKTFFGARWIAHEMTMSPDDVMKTYNVDLKKGSFTEYREDGDLGVKSGGRGEDATGEGANLAPTAFARVYEVQDKQNGQFLTVCEGHDGFLSAPAEPDVKIERFWTVFALVFNEVESKKRLYPPSDVYLARHPQQEMNRSREGLREHRAANRPKYATAKGSLDKTDKDKLAGAAAHSVLELKALKPGQPVSELIQRLQMIGIDPNMYDVAPLFQDIQRTVGSQEADFGGPTGRTSATQSSISEHTKGASLADNIDDLDTMLSELAHAFSQLCLLELSPDTVTQIVGPGAVWPDAQQSREDIAKDLVLAIKAGSSGRPNAAAELANINQILPLILQVPKAQHYAYQIVQRAMTLLDIDPEELDAEAAPPISVIAQNALDSKPPTPPAAPGAPGAPGTAPPGAPAPGAPPAGPPQAQGPHGGGNAPRPPAPPQTAQPAHPAPGVTQGRPMVQA